MKSIKAILLLVAMMAISFNAKADHDQVITFDQMPEAAQVLLKQHFVSQAIPNTEVPMNLIGD